MTFLLDVNLLMALLWENHEHHRTARQWLRNVTDFVLLRQECVRVRAGAARLVADERHEASQATPQILHDGP